MKQITSIRKAVCTMANELKKEGYSLSQAFRKAWKVYRSGKQISLGEALHCAWLSAKAEEVNANCIEQNKAAAGITEETNTYTGGWRQLGYEVLHGSKALFNCCLI